MMTTIKSISATCERNEIRSIASSLEVGGGGERGYKKKIFQPNNMLRASGTKTSTGRWPVLG